MSSFQWIKNDLPKLAARARRGANAAVQQAGEFAADRIDEYTPYRTGRLLLGNKLVVRGNTAYLSNDVEYAAFVNFGTRFMAPTFFFTKGMYDAADAFPHLAVRVIGEELEGGR